MGATVTIQFMRKIAPVIMGQQHVRGWRLEQAVCDRTTEKSYKAVIQLGATIPKDRKDRKILFRGRECKGLG